MKPALRHFRPLTELRRALLSACGAGYLLGQVPIAVSQDSAKKATASTASQDTTKKGTATPAPDTAQTRSADQLDALVAPIALYSDDLLAQTLVASTYPLEIVQLHQWLAKNPGLKDKALADSVAKQPWDPSIQSMAAIPEVVKRLADDIQWTTELGNAFLAQQSDVMGAVQRMRKKAKDKGALESNEQQKVETKVVEKKEVIIVESKNPEVIYVPSYSPAVVYGPPPVYYPYPPIYYPPYTPGMAFVSFGVGMMWGAAMWGGACCHAGWGGNNIYINNNNNFNRNTNINRNTNVRGGGGRGGNNWQHNPQHRGGAPYADQRTANRYGGSTRGQTQRGAGASNRASGTGQGQRNAGVSERSAAGGQRAGGTGDRSAGGGPGDRGGGGNRSLGAGSGGVGGDQIGNRSIPRDTGRSSGGGWGGGGGGYNGGSARASSSRGASSMRGGGGGGGRRR
jgi:Protein of unknown function (DUF3300)